MKTYMDGFVKVNGINIHYYRSIPANGGQPVVLLHGLTDNGMCWVRVADALCDTYDVILPDTRGHGFSDKPDSGYTIEDQAADVAGLIGALSLDQPVLFGHSLGGQAAAAVAGLYPNLMRGAVLEDPAWFDGSGTEEQGAENARRWRSELLHHQSLEREALIAECSQNNPGWHADEIAAWSVARYQMSDTALVHILLSTRGGWQEFVRRAVCPFLLVTAEPERGAIITPAMVKEAAALWKRGREAHIANAGHCIHRDHFDAFMVEVKLFLEEVFLSGK